jgi:hypothetical protein
LENQAIDGPVAIEVGLEGLTEAGLDDGERALFTMLERRRSMVEKMFA